MKKRILPFLLLLFIGSSGYSNSDRKEGDQVYVTLRKIGHEVLLASGDRTSWLLPIEKIDDRTFRIRFERRFAFSPDLLVKVIHRYLVQDQLPLDYLVEVVDRQNHQLMYSYAVSESLADSSIPCLQRLPPTAFYDVNIKFAQAPVDVSARAGTKLTGWLLLLFVLLLGIAWLFFRPTTRPLIAREVESGSDVLSMGQFTFCLEKQILRQGKERIELSAKESKLLNVFASAPNEVIDRDRLMKLVWEDEGVFVGRSLDVFVSRLRKKLQPEASVRIVNIHGKGYKLEIDTQNHQVKYA